MDKWLLIENKADEKAEITIEGVIGGGFWEEGATSSQVREDLKEIENLKAKEITVNLRSLGGCVIHGLGIYNALKENPAIININIDEWCASIATIIAQAGDVINMHDSLMFIIHNGAGMPQERPTKEILQKQIEKLEKVDDQILDIYMLKSTKSREETKEMMTNETFLTTQEAKEWGFIDNVINEIPRKISAHYTPELLNKYNIKMEAKDEEKTFIGKMTEMLDGFKAEILGTKESKEFTDLKANIETFKTDINTEMEEKTSEIATKETEIATLSEKLITLEASILEKDSEITALKTGKEFVASTETNPKKDAETVVNVSKPKELTTEEIELNNHANSLVARLGDKITE